MTDELQRNIAGLFIPGNEKPFFIQYALREGTLFQVQATMGALTGVNRFMPAVMAVQTLAGNYQLSNINLSGTDYWSGGRTDIAPVDNDYDELRRRLWLLTDNTYKSAVEEYGNKTSSLKQLNLPEDVLELPDFIRLSATVYSGPFGNITYNEGYWEKLARDCSGVFKKYPKIYGSNVGVEIYSGNTYGVNSEGTRLRHPSKMITIAVNAYTKTKDGEEISDRLAYYGLSENDLPKIETMMKDIEAMAENLVRLIDAPKIEESYIGPIMIEGSVLASEMVSELLSVRTGLIAYRTPLRSGGIQKLPEDRLNRRILSSDITVKSIPGMKSYNGQTLIGSYEVDAEGVTPAAEMLLVENGMLRALMCDRVPTKKIKAPTGNRIYAYGPQSISTRVSPGVLFIDTSNGLSRDTLKARLLAAAEKEGLDYAYIIRGLPNGRTSFIYKVSAKTGIEEPVRAGVVSGTGLNRLKRSLGVSAETGVLNMIAGGIPLSVICPEAMVIEEAEIEIRNLQSTTKLPLVSNPLEE